jgi:hypothetical protein
LGFESIRDEVHAWDASALPPVFGLAQLILLCHDEQALQQIPTLLAVGDITCQDLHDWPLFDRLRANGALQGICRLASQASDLTALRSARRCWGLMWTLSVVLHAERMRFTG